VLQGNEAWLQHGDWLEDHWPTLTAAIRQRFELASRIAPPDVRAAQEMRRQAVAELASLLSHGDTLMIMPTVPGPAPLRSADSAAVETARQHSQEMLCIAGLAGLPQISIPWIRVDGAPVGLSLIGGSGADELLLGAAQDFHHFFTSTGED
jgi:Asp-tRNA(Asn)/Glu-tRNA(Gln) amidotransferase A subunit family amidase